MVLGGGRDLSKLASGFGAGRDLSKLASGFGAGRDLSKFASGFGEAGISRLGTNGGGVSVAGLQMR